MEQPHGESGGGNADPLRPGSYELTEAADKSQTTTASQPLTSTRKRSQNGDGVDELRSRIHAELEHNGAFQRIREIVLDVTRRTAGEVSAQQSAASGTGDHSGKLDDLGALARALSNIIPQSSQQHGSPPLPSPNTHHLQVEVSNAQAFTVSLLQASSGSEHDESPRYQSLIALHMHYKSQRFVTVPVALAAEPAFDETVLFELGPLGPGSPAEEYLDILSRSEPIQLALMRYDVPKDFDVAAHVAQFSSTSSASGGGMSPEAEFFLRQSSVSVELLATQRVEHWQRALSRPGGIFDTSVALARAGPDASAFRTQVPVGVVAMKFRVIGANSGSAYTPDQAAAPESSESLPVVLDDDRRLAWRKERTDASALALQQLRRYTHIWWRDFTDLATSFKHRTVQIYGEDPGSGEDQLVCKFVTPLQAHHVIDGPLQASRFVSLIGYVAPRGVGQRRLIEKWPCIHDVLVQQCGSARDHAVLLCSLLLGFYLDAFVCVGTVVASTVGDDDAKGVAQAEQRGSRTDDAEEKLHYWVLTRNSAHSVTFWEPLSGRRFQHPPADAEAAMYDYLRIGCVFNHRYFFANAQPSDEVVHCNFNLENAQEWKSMDPRIIKSQSMPVQLRVPLQAPSIDAKQLSADLELELKVLIEQYREGIRLPTYWNDEISYLLAPALSAYEHERLYGTSSSKEGNATALALFKQSVKRAVPEGASFRAYPAQCRFPNARRILRLMLADHAARVVAETRGSRVRFGLRVHVFPYPENVVAVWFVLAVIYLPSRS